MLLERHVKSKEHACVLEDDEADSLKLTVAAEMKVALLMQRVAALDKVTKIN